MESNVQLLTASESVLPGEVAQLARRAGELAELVARIHQKCDHMVEDVLLECDDLQVRLSSAGSQLSGIRSSLKAACK